jgi:YggT family protein
LERPVLLRIVYDLLQYVLSFYWWVVILAAVMSNLISFGVLDTRNRLVWTVADFLYRLTEPALRRIRNFLPNFGGLDLSPIVLLLLIWVGQQVLARVFAAIVTGVIQPLLY